MPNFAGIREKFIPRRWAPKIRPLAKSFLLIALGVALPAIEASAFLRAAPKPPAGSSANIEAADSEIPTPSGHESRRAIDSRSLLDPNNPDIDRLQKIEEATRHLPYDPIGFPDWMRALREGLIQPRSDLQGRGGMEILDLDIIMKNTREMPNVRFPHRSHTMWLACSNCHPYPFKAQAGSTSIRMADIFRGEYCGMCHDRVAFITFFSCSRCHSVPQGSVGNKP